MRPTLTLAHAPPTARLWKHDATGALAGARVRHDWLNLMTLKSYREILSA